MNCPIHEETCYLCIYEVSGRCTHNPLNTVLIDDIRETKPEKGLISSEKHQLQQLKGEVAWCRDKIGLILDALLAKKILVKGDDGGLIVNKRIHKDII